MALYRSGNRFKLLELESENFLLVFSGEIADEKSRALELNKNVPATIIVNRNR